MAGYGPAPKAPQERRRRNAPMANTVQLPAAGRPGAAPKWPLPRPDDVELWVAARGLWRAVWRTPQAVVWERLGWPRVAARYVLLLAQLERLTVAGSVPPGPLMTEVRQLEDRLGLTPQALLRLRWEIVEDEVSVARDAAGGVRARLKAVDPGAVARGE